MTELQEQELWSYYGYDYAATSASDNYGYGTTYNRPRADQGFTTARDASWSPRRERLRRNDDRRARAR